MEECLIGNFCVTPAKGLVTFHASLTLGRGMVCGSSDRLRVRDEWEMFPFPVAPKLDRVLEANSNSNSFAFMERNLGYMWMDLRWRRVSTTRGKSMR